MTSLSFSCPGVRTERYSLSPSLIFRVRIDEDEGAGVHAVALTTQIRVEPRRREYSDAEAERLMDLFGERSRWADTMQPMQFATVATMVPGFGGATEVDVTVPCTTDLEVAAGRLLRSPRRGRGAAAAAVQRHGLRRSRRPLPATRSPASPGAPRRRTGSRSGPGRRWSACTSRTAPGSAGPATLDALIRYKNTHALPTWNHVMESLLTRSSPASPGLPGAEAVGS